jgi:hypothetical protein
MGRCYKLPRFAITHDPLISEGFNWCILVDPRDSTCLIQNQLSKIYFNRDSIFELFSLDPDSHLRNKGCGPFNEAVGANHIRTEVVTIRWHRINSDFCISMNWYVYRKSPKKLLGMIHRTTLNWFASHKQLYAA